MSSVWLRRASVVLLGICCACDDSGRTPEAMGETDPVPKADTAGEDTSSGDGADPCELAGREHECDGWGATCNGGVLETCVVDAAQCRVLFTQACTLGCEDDRCTTCDALTDPVLDAVEGDAPRQHYDLRLAGDQLVTHWRDFNGSTVGPDAGFALVDAEDPTDLAVSYLGDELTSGWVLATAVDGSTLYALDVDGLRVIDISDPTSPSLLAEFPLEATTYDMSLAWPIVCLASEDGLRLVDVSTSVPTEVAVYGEVAGSRQVECVGQAAAVLGWDLRIVDFTDPEDPSVTAEATGSNFAQYTDSLRFDGHYVYAGTYSSYNSKLWYQVGAFEYTPGVEELTEVGTVGRFEHALDTSLVGDRLYVAAGDQSAAVDVADPTDMRLEKVWYAPTGADGIVADGGTLYVGGAGVTAHSISAIPDVAFTPESTTYIGGVDFVGSLGIFARSSTGLTIEDRTDPLAPLPLSTTGGDAHDVVVDGSLAYVTFRVGNQGRLRIYDIRDPREPVALSDSIQPRPAGELTLSGNRLYTICGLGHVCIWDVLDPSNPERIDGDNVILEVTGSSSAWSRFAVRGNWLYIATSDEVIAVDMTDPLAPVEAGTAPIVSFAHGNVGFQIHGDYGYLLLGHNGTGEQELHVVDLSSPAQPTVVAEVHHEPVLGANLYPVFNASDPFWNFAVRGDRAYVSMRQGGVSVFDISNPLAPSVLTEYWTSMPAFATYEQDVYLGAYTQSAFPFPAPTGVAEQLIRQCG